jgi:prepilin signal peptidase PulO-like enzyme (type II secretory pathway)
MLPWYDLIPVVSWLVLKGRSRFSGKPIGIFELAIEVAMAAFFALSFAFWPHSFDSWQAVALFALWLVSGVGLAVLFAYDVKWFLLPDKVVYPLIAVGFAMAALHVASAPDMFSAALDTLYAVLVLGGLYFVLHVVSKGRWVGFGDVKLGVFLGLVLGSWPLALLCLFLANFIGCLYVVPLMLMGKISRTSRVPFGPFLMLGFVVAALFGQTLVDWYLALTFSGLMQ